MGVLIPTGIGVRRDGCPPPILDRCHWGWVSSSHLGQVSEGMGKYLPNWIDVRGMGVLLPPWIGSEGMSVLLLTGIGVRGDGCPPPM